MEENMEKKKGPKIGKVLSILLASILILVAVLGIVSYVYYQAYGLKEEENMQAIRMKNQEAFMRFDEPIEYGTELSYDELSAKLITYDHLLKGTTFHLFINNKEVRKDSTFTFDTVGNYTVKVILSYPYEYTPLFHKQIKNLENTKVYTFVVEDTKAPILSGIADKEIMLGDEFDPSFGITAEDEIDGALEIQIDGSVDNTKTGEYTIKVTATDKNGNVAEQTYTVTVKEKTEEKTTTQETKANTTNTNTDKPATTNKANTPKEEAPADATTKEGRLKLATAEAKRVVGQITNSGMNAETKAKAIFNYLHSNVSRQTNQSNEAYKTNFGNEAYAALILKKAACSGFCKAVTLMCNAAGLQSKHINANSWTHQWNTVLINGEWIILDAQGGIFGGTVHPLEA